MKKVAIATLCALSVASAQDKRFAFKGNAAQAGSDFVWHKTGSAEVSDSLRFIQGSNVTLTQSGNTLTIAGAAGAGSTASVRANTGWTSNGTLARDTLATNYALFGAKTFGVGGTTQAQNARAKFNVVGSGDTLATFIGDGNKAPGDSSVLIFADGKTQIRGGAMSTASVGLGVTGWVQSSLGFLVNVSNTGLSNVNTGNAFSFLNGDPFILASADDGLAIYTGSSKRQAFVTIFANGMADTTFMVRNDKNSTPDSTFMVFANGDGYFGGNNLYLGANRVRSVTGDTAFVFYSGTTQVFAILSDGSTADLVAITPFWKFFNKFRNEVLFWILAVAGILACILALLSIYAKVRMIRFGGYETLAENL